MNVPTQFFPSRRAGVILQAGAGLVLLGLGGFFLLQATQEQPDTGFLVNLLLSLILFVPVPLLIYRLYALLGSRYALERDGLRLRWGMRSEDLPLTEVEWIRPASEMVALIPGHARRSARLPLPWLSWPGAILGTRQVEGLGTIEFMASNRDNLLLVATPQRLFAISPADPQQFLRSFNRITELGSLSPMPRHSAYPVFFLARVWANRPARILILTGLGLSLALFVWVALAISTRAAFPLGFAPDGAPFEPSSSERLLLLPVLNALAYLIDLLGGLYFFRRDTQKPVAYLLWAAGIVAPVIMMVGIGKITQA